MSAGSTHDAGDASYLPGCVEFSGPRLRLSARPIGGRLEAAVLTPVLDADPVAGDSVSDVGAVHARPPGRLNKERPVRFVGGAVQVAGGVGLWLFTRRANP